jgi:ABC-type glycerol-3-phosphate transport system substrate-binding protein
MQKKISRRQLIRLAAFGGAGAAAAACGPAATPQVIKETVVVEKEKTVQVEVTKEVEKQVEVTKEVEVTAAPTKGTADFFIWGTQECDQACAAKNSADPMLAPQIKMMNMFMEKHPDVNFHWENHGWDEGLRQNVIAALMAGTQPDVIVGEFQLAQYAQLGALVPLDEVMPPDVKANAVPGTYRATMYKGKIHGLAWTSNCFALMTRKANLDEIGAAKPPGTYDEFLATAAAITTKGAGKYYGFAMEGPLGTAFGCYLRVSGHFYSKGSRFERIEGDQETYPNFNDPNHEPTWEMLRKLENYNEPGLVMEPDEGKAQSKLAAKEKYAAMLPGAAWSMGIAYPDPKSGEKPIPIFVSDLPYANDGKPASCVVGNFQHGVMTTSKYKDLGVDWVLITQTEDVQSLNFWHRRVYMPTTKSALTKIIDSPDNLDASPTNFQFSAPEYRAIAKTMRDANADAPPYFTTEAGKLWNLMRDLFVKCVTDKNSPVKSIMDDMQKQADEVMKAAA